MKYKALYFLVALYAVLSIGTLIFKTIKRNQRNEKLQEVERRIKFSADWFNRCKNLPKDSLELQGRTIDSLLSYNEETSKLIDKL